MTDTAVETASKETASAPEETLPEALGARRIAELLAERLGVPVTADDVVQLVELNHLEVSDWYKKWPLYSTKDALALDPDLVKSLVAERVVVIFHSDRGSEYMSAAYDNLCDRLGVVQSMGRVGSCFDNAAAEAFNSLIKVEYIHRHRFRTRAEAQLKIATWIADFYNTRRRHSRAGGLPPVETWVLICPSAVAQ